MRKRLISIVLLAMCYGSAFAGDEVDYSAPYITLENGELVTKYPAKEHDPNATKPDTASTVTISPSSPTPPTPLGLALVVALLALAVFLSRNHKRRNQNRGEA